MAHPKNYILWDFLCFIKKKRSEAIWICLVAAIFRGMVWGVVVYYRSGTGKGGCKKFGVLHHTFAAQLAAARRKLFQPP